LRSTTTIRGFPSLVVALMTGAGDDLSAKTRSDLREEAERVVLRIDMDPERTVSVWQAPKSEMLLAPGMWKSVPGPEPGTGAGNDEEVEAGDERSERMGRNAESGWDTGI
jgi:hypothetical protein